MQQAVMTQIDYELKRCPVCGASIEIIEGHWLLRDCALCAWCRRWFALPAAVTRVAGEVEILRRRPNEVIVKPGKGS